MHIEDINKGLGLVTPLLDDVNTDIYFADTAMLTDDATIDILADDDNTIDDDTDIDNNVDADAVYMHRREPGKKGYPPQPG